MRTAREIVALWRAARWPARALFLVVATVFVSRAVVIGPHPLADREGFHKIGAAVLGGGLYAEREVNTYPPTFSVVMAAMEVARRTVGDRPLRWIWGAAQLACLIGATFGFARLLGLQLTLGALAACWFCTWRFIAGDLNNQNVTLFLFALVAGAGALAARERYGAAGALLGLGASVKLWPAAALLPLLCTESPRARRAAAGFAAGIAAAAAAVVAALGPARAAEAMRFWIREVAPRVGGPSILNQSWRGLALRLLAVCDVQSNTCLPGDGAARIAAAVAGAAVISVVLGFVVFRPARSVRVRTLDGALLVLAVMPALPVAWFHYYAVAIPVALAVTAGHRDLAEPVRRRAVALLVAGTVLGAFLDVDLVGRRIWSAVAFYGNALAGALLLLAAGLVVREGWRIAEVEAQETGTAAATPGNARGPVEFSS